MSFPYGFAVTVERPSKFDAHGNPTPGPTHEIKRCARDQTATLETVNGQQVVVTKERILCDDTDADVAPADVLVLPDGTRWNVVGDIDRPRSPFTGWAPGCVIPVQRASGVTQKQE